jgi:phosphotriesterase-related protein
LSIIRTVRGDIAPSELGITYPHEHLLTNPPASIADRDLEMDSEEAAIRELGFFHAAGGRALVEMSPRDYGRAPEALRRISEASGVHVICTTGWHKDAFCRPWVESRSIDDLAEEIIREVQEGIDDTGVRAGVIKAGSSLNTITPAEEKAFRAAARAQRVTGAVITTHTEAGTMGLEQIELLRSEGVDPARVILGHIDRRMDYEYQRALLQTGATIIYDQLSKEKYYPDSLRVEFLVRLVGDGFDKQIMLSGDLARKSYWPSYGHWGGPGLTYILWRFVPWLREAGLTNDAIEEILVRTPARVLQMTR